MGPTTLYGLLPASFNYSLVGLTPEGILEFVTPSVPLGSCSLCLCPSVPVVPSILPCSLPSQLSALVLTAPPCILPSILAAPPGVPSLPSLPGKRSLVHSSNERVPNTLSQGSGSALGDGNSRIAKVLSLKGTPGSLGTQTHKRIKLRTTNFKVLKYYHLQDAFLAPDCQGPSCVSP